MTCRRKADIPVLTFELLLDILKWIQLDLFMFFYRKWVEKQFDHRCLDYPTHLNKTLSIVNWTAVNCFLIYRHLLSCLIYKWDKALWNAPLWNTAFKKLEAIWSFKRNISLQVFYKGCISQILLSPFLNTLLQIFLGQS